MTTSDIEYLVLICLFLFLFSIGAKKKFKHESKPLWGVDINTTNALKGMACVFILMGHYAQRRLDLESISWGISKVVWLTSASIALSWFMYFSGYGLSIKAKNSAPLLAQWLKRIKKIYLPLLVVCVTTTILYFLLPEKYSVEECERLWLSSDIHDLHHLNISVLPTIVIHTIGWRDWYVCCILLFYTFFYFSQFLEEKTNINQTYILWTFMLIYFIWAYFYFGPPQAHWYRYCWVFFGGHCHARWANWSMKYKIINCVLFFLLASSLLVQEMTMLIVYFLAFIGLLVAIIFNGKYTIDNKILACMGSISYIFYLSHIRIGYHILTYVGVNSILLWVSITLLSSYIISKYHIVTRILKRIKIFH